MSNLLEWNHNQVDSDKNRSEYEMNEEGMPDSVRYGTITPEAIENFDFKPVIYELHEELLKNCQKRLKMCEDELRENKKAKKSLQKRYDKVLQENKELKEEHESLLEEKDRRYGWLMDDADREPSVVRHLVGYCIDYVSNIDNVQDAHVECIKDMLESLLDESSDVNNMSESDRLLLTKKLHSIKKNRKQMKQKRDHAKKVVENATVNNNYYGSIGIKTDRAETIYAK